MKMKFKSALAVAALIAVTHMAATAQQNLGEMATSWTGQLTALNTAINVGAFLPGVGLAIAGFPIIKANSDNPNDPSNKESNALLLIVVGASLVAIRLRWVPASTPPSHPVATRRMQPLASAASDPVPATPAHRRGGSDLNAPAPGDTA